MAIAYHSNSAHRAVSHVLAAQALGALTSARSETLQTFLRKGWHETLRRLRNLCSWEAKALLEERPMSPASTEKDSEPRVPKESARSRGSDRQLFVQVEPHEYASV